ncbi:DUF1642 domain-containing protein [Streptococcus hyovaginalis]|uniref:DUF1642 domain-containing protein n=1 Tax=Streptococcus hyovaginalis TaxID=149015 RepID=UPI003BF87417
MNKQELEKQAEALYTDVRSFLDNTFELIDQIDEPEKPVIPKFVADWIKYSKTTFAPFIGSVCFDGLYTANYANWSRDKVKLKSWMSDEENQEIFAKAWLFGYEVEQEKLYTVEIPNPNNTSPKYKLMLVKGINGIEILRDYHNEKSDRYISQLTESEIKEDFEWAWKWAKPVEVD